MEDNAHSDDIFVLPSDSQEVKIGTQVQVKTSDYRLKSQIYSDIWTRQSRGTTRSRKL